MPLTRPEISRTGRLGFALLSVSLSLALGACQAYYGPSPIPEGYANHGKLYKSPEAARPRSIGYPYDEQHNAESAAHWKLAASDMVSRIVAKSGVPPMPVYVEPASPQTPFNASFDNFLREALIAQGFKLVSAPAPDSPVVRYNATVAEHKGGHDNEPPMRESQRATAAGTILPQTDSEAVLSVTVTAGANVVDEETGVYYIPDADKYQYSPPLIRMLPIVGER